MVWIGGYSRRGRNTDLLLVEIIQGTGGTVRFQGNILQRTNCTVFSYVKVQNGVRVEVSVGIL